MRQSIPTQPQVRKLYQISHCQWNGTCQLIVKQTHRLELYQISQCGWNCTRQCVRR